MKFISFIILINLLISFNLSAQKNLRYEGFFNNGLPEQGTASYSYYLDANNKQVWNGSFRYSVKVKETDRRFIQNFSGNYTNGFKNGVWEYTISTKDYRIANSNSYETSEIKLVASYLNGVPDGVWKYNALIQNRVKKVVNGQESWQEFKILKNCSIELKFKNGILIDTLKINDRLAETIQILFDENGFLLEEYSSSKNRLKTYNDGILYEEKIGEEQAKKTETYLAYELFKANKIKNIRIDTFSRINDANFAAIAILNDNIFNSNYFLFKYIGGEKLLKFDQVKQVYNYKFSGFYYRNLSLELNANEKYYSTKISSMDAEIELKLKRCKQLLKKNPEDANLIKSEIQLQNLLDKSKNINCWNSTIVGSLTIDVGLAIAQKTCKGIIEMKTKQTSHLEVLKTLHTLELELLNNANLLNF